MYFPKNLNIPIPKNWNKSIKKLIINIFIPLNKQKMQSEINDFVYWYNNYRCHQGIKGFAPSDMVNGVTDINWESPPKFNGKVNSKDIFELEISFNNGKKYLPIFSLKKVA